LTEKCSNPTFTTKLDNRRLKLEILAANTTLSVHWQINFVRSFALCDYAGALWVRGGCEIVELLGRCITDLVIEARNEYTTGVTSGSLKLQCITKIHIVSIVSYSK